MITNLQYQYFIADTPLLDEEIYTCYATVNSVTRFRSTMFPGKYYRTLLIKVDRISFHILYMGPPH